MILRRVIGAVLFWVCCVFSANAQDHTDTAYRTLEANVINALVQRDFVTVRDLAPEMERLIDLGLAPSGTSRVARYGLLAEIMFRVGDRVATARNYQKAADAAQQDGQWTGPEAMQVRYQLGSVLSLLDRNDEALAVAQEMLVDLSLVGRSNGPAAMDAAVLVGSVQLKLYDYGGARATFETVLGLAQRHDTEGRRLQNAYNGFAQALTELGEYDAALAQTRKAAELDTRFNDPDSEAGLYARLRLGMALERAGQIEEARAIVEPVLARAQKILAPHHDITQWARRTLEKIERFEGHGFAARALNRDIAENAVSSEDLDLRFDALVNLAKAALADGDYKSYETGLIQALRVAGNSPDISPSRAAQVMVSLSRFLVDVRGDLQAAQPVLDRAITILTRDLGPAHIDTLRARGERLYAKQIEIQTEPLWRAAQKRPVFWDGTEADKRPSDGDLEVLRQLAGAERAAGNTAAALAGLMTYVGGLADAGRFDTAFSILRAEIELRAKDRAAGRSLDPQQDYVLLETLATTYMRRGRYDDANRVFHAGVDALLAFLRRTQWTQALGGGEPIFLFGQSYGQKYASAVLKAARARPSGDRADDVAKAFEAIQLAGYGPASAAVAGATIRDHADDPEMKAFADAWQSATVTSRSGAAAPWAELDRLSREMEQAFSKYADLLISPPVALQHVQKALLAPDEALITILPATGPSGTEGAINGLVLAVTQTGAVMVELPMPWDQLVLDILDLQRTLDPVSQDRMAQLRAPLSSLEAAPAQQGKRRSAEFAFGAARRLYNAFFGVPEIAQLIAPKSTWTLVPHGETISIPFAALIVEDRNGGGGRHRTADDLRKVRWLGQERALYVAPSVNTLNTLRRQWIPAKEADTQMAYIGFGDPVFLGDLLGPLPRADSVMRGPVARRIAAVRALPRLPGTRREVQNLARLFVAGASTVKLGPDASEAQVRALDASGALRTTRILHFATHGLLSGAFDGLVEPALALTPDAAAGGDAVADGLLMASEAARLSIGADWVILSACDTAGGQTISGRGLGGLVQGFFAAGARNLLVSHWRINDRAAEMLISRTVTLSETGVAKAEALRRAMKELAADRSRDQTELPNAHPSIWAPFLIIGPG